MPCPCGTGRDEAACCGPYLAGTAAAPTALALMRSRYTAYVRGAIDYLVETHATPPDRAAIAARARDTVWRGLEIVASEAGETESFVEFIARGESGGAPFAQRERSRFRRVGGRWILRRRGRARPQRAVSVRQRSEVQALSRRIG